MLQMIRQRFLMYAGVFPYLLGSAAAFKVLGSFDFSYFLLGLAGIVAALVAVQVLNEYFDITSGTDRVFSPTEPKPVFPLRAGVVASAIAVMIGLSLAVMRGWPLLAFIGFGAMAAVFYLGPPIRWSYRGLGELMIFLAYGPFMTLGAYYLQVQGLAITPLMASLVLGFLVLALAIANEVPDYHGDRLVGKRNLVVRAGRRGAVVLYSVALSLSFAALALGLYMGAIPWASILIFLTVPLACWNVLTAGKNYNTPQRFVAAVRGAALLYVLVACLLIIGYLV